ncbi:MAG: hypothetical protein US52_C0061G0006 [candidate division WS6 bacterium GW2011_GWA2_37_6]|uniref:ATPase n=1 Tax=candidate division WS6 bacterium GW2011_GWA2_37_6 TaxID=1619087 RepID=A0A0G0GWE2_9BACT|nr:MAG: hypothetical protein US52_C0061G0006 [candidate division WS6 bacterium GW2011_GWA2_37_6]
MFVNRIFEIKSLEKLYKQNQAQLVIIYGKRRVGKTELIKKFITGKKGIYFLSDKTDINKQAIQLAHQLRELTGIKLFDLVRDWYSLAETIQEKIKEKIVIAVDEFPYLVEANKATSSIFQKVWDEYLSKTNIFLILSGSSISMMESETLAYKSPLFGRRTAQFQIKPMDFASSWEFYTDLEFPKFVEYYSILGGTPAYLNKFSTKVSLWENIKEEILIKEKYLNREVEFLLKEEFRSPAVYQLILQSISEGATKLSEITAKLEMKSTNLFTYLKTLEQLQFIEREIPITEKNPRKSKKGLYKISDNFVKFWFKYVFPNKSDIEIGSFSKTKMFINSDFTIYLGSIYEEICKELIRNMIPSMRIGRWWNNNTEIDIVGINDQDKEILFGEVKWSNKQVGTDIYLDLKSKADGIIWQDENRTERYCLCSKSGFTKDMIRLAKVENVMLIEGNKLV